MSLLTGKKGPDGQTQMGQVQISTAFESPDLLQNCLAFLRQYATDMGAHAACAVVPKKAIAYPQVVLLLLTFADCSSGGCDMHHTLLCFADALEFSQQRTV